SSVNLVCAVNGDRGDLLWVLSSRKQRTGFYRDWRSDVATVDITAPVASSVLVSDAAPKTNDTITVSHSYFDADGDAQSGTTYQWQRKVGAGAWTSITGETSSSLNLGSEGRRVGGGWRGVGVGGRE